MASTPVMSVHSKKWGDYATRITYSACTNVYYDYINQITIIITLLYW